MFLLRIPRNSEKLQDPTSMTQSRKRGSTLCHYFEKIEHYSLSFRKLRFVFEGSYYTLQNYNYYKTKQAKSPWEAAKSYNLQNL